MNACWWILAGEYLLVTVPELFAEDETISYPATHICALRNRTLRSDIWCSWSKSRYSKSFLFLLPFLHLFLLRFLLHFTTHQILPFPPSFLSFPPSFPYPSTYQRNNKTLRSDIWYLWSKVDDSIDHLFVSDFFPTQIHYIYTLYQKVCAFLPKDSILRDFDYFESIRHFHLNFTLFMTCFHVSYMFYSELANDILFRKPPSHIQSYSHTRPHVHFHFLLLR